MAKYFGYVANLNVYPDKHCDVLTNWDRFISENVGKHFSILYKYPCFEALLYNFIYKNSVLQLKP